MHLDVSFSFFFVFLLKPCLFHSVKDVVNVIANIIIKYIFK